MRTMARLAAGAAIAVACAAVAEEPEYNVCERQIREYVKREFGQTVTRIKFRFRDRQSITSMLAQSEAIVYVAECPGYYYFELTGDEYNCTRQAHYGNPPNYLLFRSANGGC